MGVKQQAFNTLEPIKFFLVTLKKSGLKVISESFITMARRQSIVKPSTSAVFGRSPCQERKKHGRSDA